MVQSEIFQSYTHFRRAETIAEGVAARHLRMLRERGGGGVVVGESWRCAWGGGSQPRLHLQPNTPMMITTLFPCEMRARSTDLYYIGYLDSIVRRQEDLATLHPSALRTEVVIGIFGVGSGG